MIGCVEMNNRVHPRYLAYPMQEITWVIDDFTRRFGYPPEHIYLQGDELIAGEVKPEAVQLEMNL
jgi:hypothetical protein